MTGSSLRDIGFACPACRLPITGEGCASCGRRYPRVAGLPDFRLESDRYLDLVAERGKAERLAAIATTTDLRGVAQAYYAMTPDVDPPRCARYLAHILGAEARGESLAAAIVDDGPVLEVGCGTGGFLVAATGRGLEVVGVDIAARWLVVARRRLDDRAVSAPLVAASAERLPWADGTFATVVADSLIEHCDDPRAALKEWRRVLRPGGRLVLWSPNRYALATDPHVRLWGLGYLPRRWADAYVGVRRGGAWVPRTLSATGAARLARGAGFAEVRTGVPPIPRSWSVGRPALHRVARVAYEAVRCLPPTRGLLRSVGPLWSLEARVASGTDRCESPGVAVSGMAACLAAEVAAGGIGFLATVLLAGRLGPAGFASLEVAAAGAGWALVLVRGGLDQIVIREAARRPRLVGRLTRQLIALRCVWAAAGLAAVGLVAAGSGSWAPLAAGLVLIPSALVADVGPRVRKEWSFLAAMQVVRAFGLIGFLGATVAGPGDLARAAAGPAVAESLVAAACALRARAADGWPVPAWRAGAAAVITRRAAMAGLTRFLRVGLYASDALALALATGTGLGAYAAGRRVSFALVAVGVVVPTLLAPGLAGAATRGRDAASAEVGRGVTILLGLFAPAALGLAVASERLLPWLFGPDYRDGAALLGLVAARLPLLLVATWLQSALVALGRESEALRATAVAAALAVAVLPIAAVGAGPIGIGAAALGVEVVALAGGIAALRKAGVDPSRDVPWRRLALGCLGLIAGVFLAARAPLAVTCLAGAAGYGAGLALGAVRWVGKAMPAMEPRPR